MIARLLVREKGIRSMVWLPIGLAAGVVLFALVGKPPGGLPFLPDWFKPQYFFYPVLYHWVYLTGFAAYAGVTGRSNRLYVALPMTACTLWLSRVLAVILGGFAIIAVQYGVLALAGLLQGQNLVDGGLRTLALGLMSSYLLGVVLAQLPGASLFEIPLRPGYLIYLIAVWVLTLIVAMVVSAYPYLALLPVVLAVALGWRVYRSFPRGFALVSREPAGRRILRAEPRAVSREAVGLRPGRQGGEDRRADGVGGQRVLLRVLYHPWLTLLLFIWLAFVGIRNAGYGLGGLSNTTMIVWALLALSGLMSYAVPRLYMIDALPISRRTVFTCLVIPGLTVALAGYTIGTVRAKGLFVDRYIVTYGVKYYDPQYDVRVPLEYWEIASGGYPEPVEGCCDEAHAAWSTNLLKGTDLVLYSPYHTPPGSPPEFVAEQLSRAIDDVFGERIPPGELVRKYFDRTPDGGTRLKVERMDLLEDYPHLRADDWMRTLPLVYVWVGLPWFIYLSVAMGWLRTRTPGKSMLRGHLLITFTAMGLLMLMIWASSNGVTKEYKVSAAVGILLRKAAAAIPGGTPSLWAVSLLLLAGLYLLAQSRFMRYEFPVKPGGPLA